MVKGILRVLHARIVDRRPPNFVIGGQQDPYMRRWWVIPRNRFINIYLHQVLRPDDDRALHDHPWINLSIILDGGYWEITPGPNDRHQHRSEEHTSELQSLMRISYAVFCLKKNKQH